MRYLIFTIVFAVFVSFCIYITIATTENWLGFVIFSVIALVFVSWYDLRLYFKAKKKKEEEKSKQDETEEKGGRKEK